MPDYIAAAEEKIFMIMNEGILLVDLEGSTLSLTIRLRPGAVQRWRVINAQAAGNSLS